MHQSGQPLFPLEAWRIREVGFSPAQNLLNETRLLHSPSTQD